MKALVIAKRKSLTLAEYQKLADVAQEAYSSAPVMVDALEEDASTRGRNELLSKLDSTLLAMVDKRKEGKSLTEQESSLIHDGQVMVQVWLVDTKEETMSQLKQLDFKTVAQPKSGHLVIGYISVEQLETLSKLSVVRYVTLQPAAA